MVTFAPVTFDAGVSNPPSKLDNVYSNILSLVPVGPPILETLVDTLYADGETPLIFIGVPTSKPCGCSVVTVTSLSANTPSPACHLIILIGSAAKAPTISNSGLLFANP